MPRAKPIVPSEVTPFPPPLARLIRFVKGEEINHLACDFDQTKNLLRINEELYAQASSKQQDQLWRARSSITF